MALDLALLIQSFGAYYKPGSDNEKNLRKKLYQASQTAALFADRLTEDTVWRGTLASLDRIIQPFQKAFTPIGTTKFVPNEFPLFKIKADMKETPDDIEPTYLGFLNSQTDLDRSNWRLIRYIIEEHAMPKMKEDLELNEYFAGVYAAPNAGVAGAAGTAMNGLRKVIRDYNTSGRTNLGNGAIVTGAAAADDKDFCTQIEDFAESIPSIFRSRVDSIVMSETLARKYRRGKRQKYNINYAQVNDLSTVEDVPNINVIGLISMESSGLYFSTIKENRVRPVKRALLGSTMRVESEVREVKMFTDWWEALNFEVPEFIFHNDQDLA
jgi:hypothetical protein